MRRLLILLLILTPLFAVAQSVTDAENRSRQLSLTLTPPLFQLGISPGTQWKSSVKLVNANPYPITVYARVVSFRPEGESGNASFAPLGREDERNPKELTGWITVPNTPISVTQDQTAEIPISISVPLDASPGGHYAAILVGTEPPGIAKGESAVSVGSMLASLVFVRVPGEVKEEGNIRDFFSEESFVEHPDVTFIVRFENTGNVHILPRGEITIFNMWGKERGQIAINDEANFGNVLPQTTRRFVFAWKGEESVFEFGRYTARATLSYGVEGKRTVYRETAFWVIPWKPVSAAFLGVILTILFITFAIKRYVRRVLDIERSRLGVREGRAEPVIPPKVTVRSLSLPLQEDIRTIRTAQQRVLCQSTPQPVFPFLTLLKQNALYVAALGLLACAIILVLWYFVEVFRAERSYQVEVIRETPSGSISTGSR